MDDTKPTAVDITVTEGGTTNTVQVSAEPAADQPLAAAGDAPPADADITQPSDISRVRISIDGKDVDIQGDVEAVLDKAVPGEVHVDLESPDRSDILAGLGGVALVIFVLFVLPIWIISHYLSKRRKQPHGQAPAYAVPANANDLAQLVQIAERLERRLDAMESLMDAENPHWRRK